jgi:tRNA (guanosine-2'-O-)-methyltransferase
MRTSLPLFTLALAALLGTSGCYVRARTRTTTETTPVRATVTVNATDTAVVTPPATTTVVGTAGSGVIVIAPNCSPGAGESCDGLDNNCDGRIDEGCGWGSGQIQVTLAWGTGADMDLYVYDPSGYQIYYADRYSPSGGMLDHDARGFCTGGTDTVENVYWSSPTPPPGNYTVEVHYWGDCGDPRAIPTPVQVSISVGGRVIGVYQATLYPNQRATIATFPIY